MRQWLPSGLLVADGPLKDAVGSSDACTEASWGVRTDSGDVWPDQVSMAGWPMRGVT